MPALWWNAQPLRSLKSQLLIWLLVPLALILPVRAWIQYDLTIRHTNEAFDHSLANTATAFANLIRVEERQVSFEPAEETERSLRTDAIDDVTYAVLGPRGQLLAGDPGLALLDWPGLPAELRFTHQMLNGEPVRAVSRQVRCGSATCEVRVAETLRKRERIESEALLGTIQFMLLLAAVLMVAIWWSVARVLRPLSALSEQVSYRSLQDLRPLDARGVPSEVHPFVTAINQLFSRLEKGARDQQAFLADAAHQLRTPLTALRTEAELALLEPHPPALEPTLTRLHHSAERAARLASQLLSQARLETAGRPRRAERFDLHDIADAAAQEWVPHLLADGVDLGFQLAHAPVRGEPHLVQELLSNLIHNALLYATSEARAAGEIPRVTVRTRQETDADGRRWSVLVVDDNGPGIPSAERGLVLERFYRGQQATGDGSGLGLAIVRDIAQSHRAELQLAEGPEGRGLSVLVRFPFAQVEDTPAAGPGAHA